MSSAIAHLDGNAAAGELSTVFGVDVTAAEVQCGSCGATRRFAEAHVYMNAPGIVARCWFCEQVLVRIVHARRAVFVDVSGVTYLRVEVPE
jgi:Family of unknown function (DUF6510)